jgi:hypothetical protein
VKTSMFFKIVLILIILLMFSGCAYRYYLGMHGPSIQRPRGHAHHTSGFYRVSEMSQR